MNPAQQPQQLQPQRSVIAITNSVYDEITDDYDELIDLDAETYDHPDAVPDSFVPNSYQHLGAAESSTVNPDHDDDSSDKEEYADLDRRTNKNDEPSDAEPGHAAPDSHQQLDTAPENPLSSNTNPIYLELIDDEVKETKDNCGV